MDQPQVFYEATPNPQSMKFVVTRPISPAAVNFLTVAESKRSPLAQKLFGFPWAAGIFIGTNFVTVTKQDWVDWDILADPLAELIREHVASGEPVLLADAPSAVPAREDDVTDADPVVATIKRILADEIRPAVAMDGGDVVFDRFENGRVYLHLRGACSGCPSSAYTLKEGIETRIRRAVPEVLEVVAVE